MEELNAPDIEYEKDGSVILYYKNQSIDITHKFNKDNICYVKLVDGDDSLYVTVKYNNGYASSPNKYISPWEFNKLALPTEILYINIRMALLLSVYFYTKICKRGCH